MILRIVMTGVGVAAMLMLDVAAILGMAGAGDSVAGILAIQAVLLVLFSSVLGAMYISWWSES
jgi:hypothetical protein